MDLLDMFGLDWGVVNWLLALVGEVIGASLLSRFKDWGVIFLAALVGALLTTPGLQMLFPSINEAITSLIGLILLGFGIVNQDGIIRKKNRKLIFSRARHYSNLQKLPG